MAETTGMYLENAEKFVAAMKAMPTEEFLRGVIEQASIWAYNEAKLRPTPMAHTYGSNIVKQRQRGDAGQGILAARAWLILQAENNQRAHGS